ncbi:AraC family transcriptional regulator [Inconstantimicrobium porci]|uniref:AraC family transcriptional regulator n=1 Tax=Inconstantimicrobium porci TaxID=2652291 RepID=UPI0024093652|nr:GyrI-like domain-containing protein [Inconstantimicrobium porci]MDD6771649.1 GyrI-like domain-containing protein [Inconstantimicrobium porci]
MNLEIEEIKQLRIAYIRKIGPYGEENYTTMKKIKTWAKDNNLFNDDLIILGIAEDNPAVTKPEECRYDTCAIIAEDYHVNDNAVSEGRIVGGRYAVFKVEHTAEAVQKAWSCIFEEISNHGCNMDGTRPIIERYKVGMVNSGYCEICVPIV